MHDRLDEGLSGEVDGTMAPGWLCFDDDDFKSAPGESMDIRATAVARAPAPRPPRRRMIMICGWIVRAATFTYLFTYQNATGSAW